MNNIRGRKAWPAVLLLAAAALLGGARASRATTIVVHERLFYALTASDRILTFDIHTPGTIDRSVAIVGLRPGEHVLAIDVRPSTGQLYGLGSTGRLYVINPQTGAAQQVGAAPFAVALAGEDFGMDFDPATETVRVVSDADQNLAVNPNTGEATAGPALAYAAGDPNAGADPHVVALNYVTVFDGGQSSTALYGIDTALDVLVVIDDPAAGLLRTRGPLGADLPGAVGFANAQAAGLPFALVKRDSEPKPEIFLLHLLPSFPDVPGRADRLTTVNTTEAVRGFAVGKVVGTFQFAQTEHRVVEDATSVRVTVTRSGDVSQPASVSYALRCDPGTLVACVADRQASRLSDYTDRIGTLFFGPGEASRTFSVLVNEDSIVESPEGETVTFTLFNPTGNFGLAPPLMSTLVILDDDSAGAANVIDDARAFVHQHYHDFLGREADAAGLAFWTSQIEECGADSACTDLRRQNVSAAFFLSGEFQETGFVAYLARQAAFATGSRLGLSDFLSDQGLLGEGVIVGEPDADARLEANKRLFFDEFVSRPEFLAAYPLSMAPGEFVAALNQNASGALSAEERERLAGQLARGEATRAGVLRALTEDRDFRESERRRAFVLMQYFGYLRREPDEAGFRFWLKKLDDHGGDFVAAEMVRSFLVSSEYRGRFGQ